MDSNTIDDVDRLRTHAFKLRRNNPGSISHDLAAHSIEEACGIIEKLSAVHAETGDAKCTEADGCPTERAVLQRSWREQQDQIPLNSETVLCYLIALGQEASDRGSMFPQTSDEQDNDSRCLSRVRDMVTWYADRGGNYPTYNQVAHWRKLRARNSKQATEPELRKVEPRKPSW